MLSADLSATTPDHILGGLTKLKEDVAAGTDYMESNAGDKGHYIVTANPERYSTRLVIAFPLDGFNRINAIETDIMLRDPIEWWNATSGRFLVFPRGCAPRASPAVALA